MRKIIYWIGRLLQLIALIVMPLSIWVGQLGHNERGAIIIFVGSIFLFVMGWIISQIRSFYES